MKTIAICNHKGGVGKTALSMAIAEGLHRKGKRTSVPAIYSLAKGDNPRRAKYDKNADVIGYNLRLPANIHRLLKRHCMETNESMNNVVLVALYRDMKNWEDLAPCPHCGAILPVGAQFCPDCGKEI